MEYLLLSGDLCFPPAILPEKLHSPCHRNLLFLPEHVQYFAIVELHARLVYSFEVDGG